MKANAKLYAIPSRGRKANAIAHRIAPGQTVALCGVYVLPTPRSRWRFRDSRGRKPVAALCPKCKRIHG